MGVCVLRGQALEFGHSLIYRVAARHANDQLVAKQPNSGCRVEILCQGGVQLCQGGVPVAAQEAGVAEVVDELLGHATVAHPPGQHESFTVELGRLGVVDLAQVVTTHRHRRQDEFAVPDLARNILCAADQ